MQAAGITIFEISTRLFVFCPNIQLPWGRKITQVLQFPASVMHYQLELINSPAMVENILSTKAKKRKLLDKRYQLFAIILSKRLSFFLCQPLFFTCHRSKDRGLEGAGVLERGSWANFFVLQFGGIGIRNRGDSFIRMHVNVWLSA